MKNLKVREKDDGIRLVAFLYRVFNGLYSSKKLKKAIENNFCTVNHRTERFASFSLKAGDTVRFDCDAMQDLPRAQIQIEQNRILYEDDVLFIYNKPAGSTSDTDLALLFPDYVLIHRLDKETTGALLFAKNNTVKQALIELFRKFEVQKVYLALVDGVLEKKSGVIENYLGRITLEGKAEVRFGVVSRDKGKFAKTSWICEKQGPLAALVKCFPETGRTHQIRVHLKGLGAPILGDYRYAKQFLSSFQAKRCMLHALELSFIHPVTGKILKVEAPLPEDFKEAMKRVVL